MKATQKKREEEGTAAQKVFLNGINIVTLTLLDVGKNIWKRRIRIRELVYLDDTVELEGQTFFFFLIFIIYFSIDSQVDLRLRRDYVDLGDGG